MKFLAVFIAVLLAFSTPAEAAQKRIAVKKIEKIASTPGAELLVATGSSIVTISNVDSTTSDIALNAMDISGAAQWSKAIDAGVDELAAHTQIEHVANVL